MCVYPQFIVTAQRALTAHTLNDQVKIATVTNFPNGGDDIMAAARETRDAVASGAHGVKLKSGVWEVGRVAYPVD
ncbi:hypothetical protein HSBAA_14550 [Vreelandella sulfidaeris]|uniref:Deoxyribose-phosphate aldolase n=1 Tax=Vreelandella sulfidaeris TaxID=115553 RepID=A0A455U5Q0_9GAMM|nr:hypothetical protein HSBAA_14550 [Halomonas sulfidaeris]